MGGEGLHAVLAGNGRGNGLGLVVRDIGHDDVGSLLPQAPRQRLPQALAGTRDNGIPALQAAQSAHGSISFRNSASASTVQECCGPSLAYTLGSTSLRSSKRVTGKFRTWG